MKEQVKRLLEVVKEQHYNEPATVTDEQAMGILMAQYFEWDGLAILRATFEGLEDSNFHTENKTIQAMIEKIEVQIAEEEAKARQARILRFDYVNQKGERSNRLVKVSEEAPRYVRGMDLDKNEIRTFSYDSMSNIKEVKI
jgi:hypothetical protein